MMGKHIEFEKLTDEELKEAIAQFKNEQTAAHLNYINTIREERRRKYDKLVGKCFKVKVYEDVEDAYTIFIKIHSLDISGAPKGWYFRIYDSFSEALFEISREPVYLDRYEWVFDNEYYSIQEDEFYSALNSIRSRLLDYANKTNS